MSKPKRPSTSNKDAFIEAISIHLAPRYFKGSTLLKFILNLSYRWNNPLDQGDVMDVLVESVKRGVEYIEKTGKPINKPEAWLKTTCTYVLRDKIRRMIQYERCIRLESERLRESMYPPANVEFCEHCDFLVAAMKQLSPRDRAIIQWRYNGKTYEQIQKNLKEEENITISIPTLRKRESRAIERLKTEFFKLYDGVPIC
jgi:RNA polymerase sigma factor (sigma-70 family)